MEGPHTCEVYSYSAPDRTEEKVAIFFFFLFGIQKKKLSKKCNAPLRKMLAPGKKRGTSVTRWLPYRDGNRLTKVVLGDVEVVLAKYYPCPPLIY
jgi:hypothetical protein